MSAGCKKIHFMYFWIFILMYNNKVIFNNVGILDVALLWIPFIKKYLKTNQMIVKIFPMHTSNNKNDIY